MEVIQVNGLPPDVVRSLRDMVEVLQERLRPAPQSGGSRTTVALPAWPGKVIASIARKDIYAYAG